VSAPALSRRAAKDLAGIARRDRETASALVRLLAALTDTPPPENLDVRPLQGRPPWRRARLGSWRIVYRPLTDEERAALGRQRGESVEPGTVYVERIVNRRDLEKIVAALP
jgi:mRNA-degrading endonuclease RelE of RelBE toxin-antitoxin system